MPAFKIASGDLTNTPLLRHVAALGKPMVVSTGGATMEDVDRAVETVLPINPQLCILQCTAAYPADVEELNLGVITTYRERYPDVVDRPLRPPGRHRDGARRVHARRAGDREALHAQPHDEGHRPRVLADARGHAEARARPEARRPAALGDGVKQPLPAEEAALRKMGKKLVAARDLDGRSRRCRRRPRGRSRLRTAGCRPTSSIVLSAAGSCARWALRSRTSRSPKRFCESMTDPLFDLTGRVAVVTGGLGQLGAAYAAGLAARGMRVAVFDVERRAGR